MTSRCFASTSFDRLHDPKRLARNHLSLQHHANGKPLHIDRYRTTSNQRSRAFSVLSPIRPALMPHHTCVESLPLSASSPDPKALLPSIQQPLDLIPRISAHPSLASIQVRNGPRDTYNPSHRVRKRRHGFLARVRTRKGTMILKRRKLKGRSTLSH